MVVMEGHLVDKVKPGDRVEITGVYKAVAQHTSAHNGFFKTILVATGVKPMSEVRDNMDITKHDIKNIRMIAKKQDVMDTLASSIAPSIQGHINIKRALLLQLLGGVEKNLPNGAHLRGDINILMVGDPSTAKSQLL